MDYDENDSQGKDLQLAGEGRNKFPPVLRPYALPKFDFDDSLQGNLRFDNLVETEVFLGIESQEENHWIEDFSHGSNGIEFSSSAVESVSISRCNNVWLEATSSESVAMLLKSVGQEEMIPGQATVEESDACDELGNSIEQVDASLEQDNNNCFEVKNAVDSNPILPPKLLLESFPGFNNDATKLPHIEDATQPQGGEASTYGSSCDLDPNVGGEKQDHLLTDGNNIMDSKVNQTIGTSCDEPSEMEVDISSDEAIRSRIHDDNLSSMMQVDDSNVSSVQNVDIGIGVLSQENIDQTNSITNVEKENVEGEDHQVLDKKDQMGVVEGDATESHFSNLEKLTSTSTRNHVELDAVETSINNVDETFSMTVREKSDSPTVEECCPGDPVNPVKIDTEVPASFEDKGTGNFSQRSSQDRPLVALKGDNSFQENISEDSCANIELKTDSLAHTSDVQGIVKQNELIERGDQLDSVKPEASLLSGEDDKISGGPCDVICKTTVADISIQKVVFSSAELLSGTHASEDLHGVPDASRASGEVLNAGALISSFVTADSVCCKTPVVSEQSASSLIMETENVELPADSRDMGKIDGSIISDKKVGSSSLGEESNRSETIDCNSQLGISTVDDTASLTSSEDFKLASIVASGVPLSPVDGVTRYEISDGKDDGDLAMKDGSEVVKSRNPISDFEQSAPVHEADENHQEGTLGGDTQETPSILAGDISNVQVASGCDANSHVLEGDMDSDRLKCGSAVVGCNEISEDKIENQDGKEGHMDQGIPPLDINAGATHEMSFDPQDPKERDASKTERSSTFEVSSLAASSQRNTDKTVEGSPSVSGSSQAESRMAQKIIQGNPRPSDRGIVPSGTKSTSERKARRASGRSTGKESAKKGSRVKETITMKPLERVEKPSSVLTAGGSSLPDLNSSSSLPVIFQQPFTDLQQLQLRAQIFVYGSLIQGTAPDEACMISAFGGTDGGRNIWENAWRVSLERLHGQKSHPVTPETPLQQQSGSKVSDHVNKPAAVPSKVVASPLGRTSKGTPSPISNPMIPLSSPLWTMHTPSRNGQQSGGMPRGLFMDHNVLPPFHPHQTPPIRNLVGPSTSWTSQNPFPLPWASPTQPPMFDASARFSAKPITEPVKLTPVRESSVPQSSGINHVPLSPIIHTVGPTGAYAVNSPSVDVKKTTFTPGQTATDPKPRKRKKAQTPDDLSQIPLLSQTRAQAVSAPCTSNCLSSSVVVSTPAVISKANTGKSVNVMPPATSADYMKVGDMDVDKRAALSEDTLGKVEEAKLQAENAAALAASAVDYSQSIWNQLDKQRNCGLLPDVEAKLASAAAAIAAAASVAKAAAAAAKVASGAALQAKLMAEEALASNKISNPGPSNVLPLLDGINTLEKATPASILKGEDRTNSSSSFIFAAREAARHKIEAALAASKRAENLDAIVKAAELAAQAVTQAGKVVAMGDPLPLSELVEAGPEGYWKIPLASSDQGVKSNFFGEQSRINSIEGGPDSFSKKLPTPRDTLRESTDDHTRLVDLISGSVTNGAKGVSGHKGHKASNLSRSVAVVSESGVRSKSSSLVVRSDSVKTVGTLGENSIKEGSLVEVLRGEDASQAAWFSAHVLRLDDGKAYVSYAEIPAAEGSGQLKEWILLGGEGNKAPMIRLPHPMTTVPFEGTRKRRRAAMGNYAWSVGDRVDAWMRDSWKEGVIREKSAKDETTLTVHFPAQGETSVVKAWHLRPSLTWKDGEWVEGSSLIGNDFSSHEGDTPQEKRLKLGSPQLEVKGKNITSKTINDTKSGMPEGSRLVGLSEVEGTFNIGKSSRDDNKSDSRRMMRTGLQKEGSKVVFGIPKPGKKRKFMDVSKHYDGSSKTNEAVDSLKDKSAKVLMPQGLGLRGWKNSSKVDHRDRQATEPKPRVPKSGKQPGVSSRTIPQKNRLDSFGIDGTANGKDSATQSENASGKQSSKEFGAFSAEGVPDGTFVFSSLAPPSNDSSSKKSSTLNSRTSKGKLGPAGKLSKIEEDKVYGGNSGRSGPEAVEPRRSNRRIQPTSRLLEGIQSSLSISKIPSVSHDKGHKSQNKSTLSRGH